MASRKIAEKDLDFAIHWDRQDEMGALCASFEEMRRALWENNRVMWRQMEERKRLNAAFAHDLRTPLTVLRGYAGMLGRDHAEGADPADMAQEVRVMEAQVRRLEDYVQAMSSCSGWRTSRSARLGALFRPARPDGKRDGYFARGQADRAGRARRGGRLCWTWSG